MLYNNLIYFLVAIFTFSTNSPVDSPWMPWWGFIVASVMLLGGFSFVAKRLYSSALTEKSVRYFSIERKLSILAVGCFILWVYFLDLKYYLQPLSLGGKLPILENLGGLSAFFLLFCVIWHQARPLYQQLFHREYNSFAFLLSNIKINLPIILPWLLLSFTFDILVLLPFPGLKKILVSPWGDLILFAVFVVFLVLFFPPLVRRLWDCRPMPEGQMREKILAFCRTQGFGSEILYWPLFEGQVITAGIMGIVPGFRYLLVTPALLEALSEKELESVLAHEIGHVKNKHLIFYVLLFLGFSVFAGSLARPMPHFILSSDTYYWLLGKMSLSPDTLLGILGAIPLLVLLIVYFRLIFGFFIRNFERQADASVFRAQGTGVHLISSFERIAVLTGTSREEKNWHHFGLGERIGFLEQCEQNRLAIGRQDRKVYAFMLLYFCCIAGLSFSVQQLDLQKISAGYEVKYAEAVLLQKSRQEPGNSLWPVLLGNLMQSEKMESKAVEAYEQAAKLRPTSVEVNNNLAWLLLTAKDKTLRDPVRALTLARTAVLLDEKGFVLDTLATAFWANRLIENAVESEVRAIRLDPGNRRYYIEQIQRFQSNRWGEECSGARGQ